MHSTLGKLTRDWQPANRDLLLAPQHQPALLHPGSGKALIVDGSGNGYLKTACDYVHLNPARAKVIRRELLEQVATRPGPSHFGEAETAQAERWVVEGLKAMGWSEADLRARRKGELRKVALARALRARTTMPLAWIAARLSMGTRGHLAWLLQQRPSRRQPAPQDQGLLGI